MAAENLGKTKSMNIFKIGTRQGIYPSPDTG